MKKQLLTALLALTPFFATAKPSNAELLAHLKNVKADIKNQLQEISEAEKEVKAELGLQAYINLTNKWNAVHNATAKELKKIELEVYFDRICQMNSMNEAKDAAADAFTSALLANVNLINVDYETVDDHSQASLIIGCITGERRFFNSLLKQIEAKIKELETQN